MEGMFMNAHKNKLNNINLFPTSFNTKCVVHNNGLIKYYRNGDK